MAIETVTFYHPGMRHPLWLKVTTPRQNDYTVGKKYEIRVEDKDRASSEGVMSDYNYAHEALLVGKWIEELQDVPQEVLGYASNSDKWSEVKDILFPWADDESGLPDEVVILCFLRIDKAEELVVDGPESIPGDFNKEAIEE